ncbi:MAG: hypothetical protein ACKOC5_05040, partial [Chloroflexota bacterium]
MNEPSVLDYLKYRLMPWKYPPVIIPPAAELPDSSAPAGGAEPSSRAATAGNAAATLGSAAGLADRAAPDGAEVFQGALAEAAQATAQAAALPYLSLLALAAALLGQFALGPGPQRAWLPGTALLLLGAGLAALAARRGEWRIPPLDEDVWPSDPLTVNAGRLAAGLALALAAALFFLLSARTAGEPRFNLVTLPLTLAAAYFTARAFWGHAPGVNWRSVLPRTIRLEGELLPRLGALAAVLLVLFFRLYRLGEVPPEMNSDHAEKILDVLGVLNGQFRVFFAANGGREALIFYLNALLHLLTGIPLGFMMLKIVSVTIGLAALPFIYYFGKELGGPRLG